jgi:6-phosphofructokinase 1
VINASLAGVLHEAKTIPQIDRIYGMKQGIEGALKGELYDLTDEPADLVDKLMYTPASVLGSCRYQLTKDEEYERLLRLFAEYNIRYFVYIGGNDSMDTCHKISELTREQGYEMQAIGVPKTVDNDLPETDHCPGYGSAARFIALSTVESGRDLEAMQTFEDVAIYEIMGRHTGWLVGASAVGKRCEADAPHLIYMPERTFNEEKFLADVKTLHDKQGYVYVALSEGVRDTDGEFIGARDARVDSFGHTAISFGTGPGIYLCNLLGARLGLKARCNRPGTIQRSLASVASSSDVKEAFMVGKKAVQLCAEGVSDKMVTLECSRGTHYECTAGQVPLERVANVEKFLPEHFINTEGNFVTGEFIDYCAPLIGKPIPDYARLGQGRRS